MMNQNEPLEPSFISALGLSINTGSVFLLVLLLTVLIYYLYLTIYPHQKTPLPPGPKGWPIVGCLPYLAGKDARKVLAKYVEQYGDVYQVHLGREPVVLLNSVAAIKEAFAQMGHSFSDRPHILFIDYITEGQGLISASGKLWREHRHFSHTVLKDFGMGRPMLEDKIHDGISLMLAELEKLNLTEFDVHRLLIMTVSNVINRIVLSKSYDYDDPFFIHMIEAYEYSFQVLGSAGIVNFFPSLVHLPGDFFQIERIMKDKDMIHNVYRKLCEEHQESLDPHHDRDFVDVYLKKFHAINQERKESTFSMNQLVQVVGDLFSAGAETTSTMLRWGFVYLLHYPDVQKKLQEEIDDVIGSSRNPSITDRPNMPYTEAYITELQRIADIVPFGVPHATTEDVMFRGYLIPKGTQIWSNLHYLHHNKQIWGDPDVFRPDRFINSEGKFEKSENVIPFSLGRRVCLGESLARMELFLFTTCILQKFTVLPPVDGTLPPLEGILGISYSPQHFSMRFEKL